MEVPFVLPKPRLAASSRGVSSKQSLGCRLLFPEILSVQSFYQWETEVATRSSSTRCAKSRAHTHYNRPPQVRSETSSSLHIMTPSGFSVRFDAAVQPQQVTKILEAIELASRGESC